MLFWWAVVFLAVFLIGVTKSGFGAGVGLMIVPMMAIALAHIPQRGSEAALGLLLPLLVFGDLIAVWQYRKLLLAPSLLGETKNAATDSFLSPLSVPRERVTVSVPINGESAGEVQEPPSPLPPPWVQPEGESLEEERSNDAPSRPTNPARQVLARLLPGTLIGVVLGGLLLAWLHTHSNIVGALIRIEIGIESILLVSLHWWRLYRGVQQRLMPEPWRSHLTGGFSAVSSTLAHAAGPIVAMYLLPLALDRQLFVGTCAIYFFLLNSAKLPVYVITGQFKHAELSFTLKFLPLVIAGALFGLWLNRRLSDKLFTKIVYVITFALGWYILADGILSLFGKHVA